MQIYLRGNCLYDFDWQKAFGARYIAKNTSASQKHRKHNRNNVKHRDNAAIKS